MNSLGKEKIKYLKSLSTKKFRQKYNKFIVEGHKILNEIPIYWEERVDLIYYTISSRNLELEKRFGEKYCCIDDKSMKSISQLSTNPGCLAVINACNYSRVPDELYGKYIFLDRINIPGNLGTIIRTAEWYGIRNIILSPGSVHLYNTKVLQATMGAIWTVNVYQSTLAEISKKECPLYLADMSGEDYKSVSWPESFILAFGNESHGMSVESISMADQIVSIPGANNSIVDSLNIAISVGILISSIK